MLAILPHPAGDSAKACTWKTDDFDREQPEIAFYL
jgi:hypothetical protein